MAKKRNMQLIRKEKIREKNHRIIVTFTWPEYVIRRIWRYRTIIYYSDQKPPQNPTTTQRLMKRRRMRRREERMQKKPLKIRKQRAVVESIHLRNRQSLKSLRYKRRNPYETEQAARNSRRGKEFDKKRNFL